MASSKRFFLLLCALFVLVFILSSQVSTSEVTSRDDDQFGNLKVNCQSPLTCCTHSRKGYCTACCCCAGSQDQNQLVVASINKQLGIDCYGLICCHYNRQGYCTACCAPSPAQEHYKLPTDQEANPVAADVEDIELITMVAK